MYQPNTRTDNTAPPIVTHTTPPPFVVRHPTVPRHYQQPTVIEKTGKAFKTWMLIGGLMAVSGFGFLVLGSLLMMVPVWGAGIVLGISGVGTWFIARVAAWWEHG